MLIPVVWFEESALIPEESARKFRSLYTDRVRLINLVLTSLFLVSLGLLAVDARLLASHYSFCFSSLKLAHLGEPVPVDASELADSAGSFASGTLRKGTSSPSSSARDSSAAPEAEPRAQPAAEKRNLLGSLDLPLLAGFVPGRAQAARAGD